MKIIENIKLAWKNLCAIGRGIKKAFEVAFNVGEALAWGGVLATCYVVTYQTLKGNISMPELQFYAVALSTAAITLRVLYEGAKYFKQIGSVEEK